jgi:arsenite/tail-anchored protein-transporting ATPase
LRIIIFSGKGGSGASTLTASTAAASAAAGRRTLAFGLGPGMGAAFGEELGVEARPVAERLDAVEGLPSFGDPDEFREWLEDLLHWRGMDVELAEDLGSLPGINHIGRLLSLAGFAASGRYDVVCVDAAPLVQFLDLPGALDAASRWLRRLFAPRQQNVFEPFLRAFAGDYAATAEEVFERGKDLLTRLAALRDDLTDPDVTSVRLSLTPDERAVEETLSAIGLLTLYSYSVDALVVNRLLPDSVTDPFFQQQHARQASAVSRLSTSVEDMPVLSAPLREAPLRGIEGLLQLARDAYGEVAPDAVLHQGHEHSIEEEGGAHVLRIAVPFARREALRLEQVEEGIAVHLDGRRCVIELPEEAAGRAASSWALEGHLLKITLER